MKIYINNFNLLTWPKSMATLLSAQGHEVMFVDNNSTYEPLLDFYSSCPYKVYRLNVNIGGSAPWDMNIVDTSDYYCVTDPDYSLHGLPLDWPEKLKEGIERHKVESCGLSYDETRIPSENPAYWEDEFYRYPQGTDYAWGKHLELEGNFYNIGNDTSFAVYHPTIKRHYINGIRAGKPYTVRHLPWHLVSKLNPSEDTFQIPFDDEILYYYKHANYVSTTKYRMHKYNLI